MWGCAWRLTAPKHAHPQPSQPLHPLQRRDRCCRRWMQQPPHTAHRACTAPPRTCATICSSVMRATAPRPHHTTPAPHLHHAYTALAPHFHRTCATICSSVMRATRPASASTPATSSTCGMARTRARSHRARATAGRACGARARGCSWWCHARLACSGAVAWPRGASHLVLGRRLPQLPAAHGVALALDQRQARGALEQQPAGGRGGGARARVCMCLHACVREWPDGTGGYCVSCDETRMLAWQNLQPAAARVPAPQ